MEDIRSFEVRHERCICFDSDGCVFDVMDLKHQECFCPAFIQQFGLQAASRAAREVWEFVNLRSESRGVNRFRAVVAALDLLREHPEVRLKAFDVPRMAGLRRWIEEESKLGEAALERVAGSDADLQVVLAWTRDVNERVKRMCGAAVPFPGATEAIASSSLHADLLVVSQAPRATLLSEWEAAGLIESVAFVAGQEYGSKAEQIRGATAGRYVEGSVLVVGDAPGDLEAGRETGAHFFPIVPGAESASWSRFVQEGLVRFRDGLFDKAYQAELVGEFEQALPSAPPWG